MKTNMKKLRFWYLYVLLFLIIAGGSFVPAIGLAIGDWMKHWDIHDIGLGLLDYAKRNNQLPPAEKWCGVLYEDANNTHSFMMYESGADYFPYTLNKHVYDQNELPDNMVILFTGNLGWNNTGELESVRNLNRIRVFLGSGDIRTFRRNQFPYLRWKFEDSGIIPKPEVKIPILVLSSLLAAVFLVVLAKHRDCLKTFWILALLIGVVSAVAGGYFGAVAEDVYYNLNYSGDFIAPWIGGIWGLIIGVTFIVIIGRIFKKYKADIKMAGYSVVIGAITGFIASVITHGYLMIIYNEPNFVYLLAGSGCFGIAAGLLLGWISSGFIWFYESKIKLLNNSIA